MRKRYRRVLVWEWRAGAMKFFRVARCIHRGCACDPVCVGCQRAGNLADVGNRASVGVRRIKFVENRRTTRAEWLNG